MRYRTLKLKQIMGQIIDKYKIHPAQLDSNSQYEWHPAEAGAVFTLTKEKLSARKTRLNGPR